jgi:exosortase/archaeosortase family protein
VNSGARGGLLLDVLSRAVTSKLSRYVISLVLVAAVLVLAVHEGTWRQMEANLGGRFIGILTGHSAYSRSGGLIYLVSGQGIVVGIFVVTAECSVGYLVVGVLLITAFLAMVRPIPVRRVLSAAVLASAILLLFNILRLGMIGLFVAQYGVKVGFPIAHTYLGTFLTIFSTVVAGIMYALVVLHGTGKRGETQQVELVEAG